MGLSSAPVYGFVTRDVTTWDIQRTRPPSSRVRHGGHSSTSVSESPSPSRDLELSSSESPSSSSSSSSPLRMPLPSGVQVRHAQAQDLKVISNIVTDAFFGRFNPLEWLKTFLSLEDSLPDADKSELYDMLVACQMESGEIIGYCEIDCRPSSNPKAAPRPYMCNLVVRDTWRKKGLGSALIQICEDKVINEWMQLALFLRVRETNVAAVRLYKKLGYEVDVDKNTNGEEGVLLLRKDFGTDLDEAG